MAQGPCYDFVQQMYLDAIGNTTLHNCMKEKLLPVGPSCITIPNVGHMSRETVTLTQCGYGMGGGGGGGSGWGGRRGGHVLPSCTPTMASIDFTTEKFNDMFKSMIKGMGEPRCDPDGEVKAEDKEK